jgi:hypothetical protein
MFQKGQASIEFVLVLVFMLVLITGIIVPLSQRIQFSLDDVGRAAAVSEGVKQLESTFGLMTGMNGDGKQQLSVFLPKGSVLLCDPAGDDLNITLPLHFSVFNSDGSIPPSCIQNAISTPFAMECQKKVVIPPSSDLHCGGSSTESFVIETGAAGFAQSFWVGVDYLSGPSPLYTIDVNAG